MAKSNVSTVVGIDLGTTNSAIAVLKNNEVIIIPNADGKHTTPSYVSFFDGEILIGEHAKSALLSNYKNTLYDMKRLIGKNKKKAEKIVQENQKYWSFEVVSDGNQPPAVKIEHNGQIQHKFPEEISALILEELKKDAETFLFNMLPSVSKAVITVPAYFSQGQKTATIKAGQKAGLEVVELITEPEAAAIAYGFYNKKFDNLNIFVVDLGGGTFDSVVVQARNGKFEVKSIGGDTNLGGRNFDNILVNHFTNLLKTKYNIEIKNERSKQRLLKECIEIKETLTKQKDAYLSLSEIDPDKDDRVNITREEFNELCLELYQKIVNIIKVTLQGAKMEAKEIDEILMIGGSSRIPKVRALVQSLFPSKKLNDVLNPDEAVAYGAALYASTYCETNAIEPKVIEQIPQILGATPLSLGLEVEGGGVSFLIARNSNVPSEQTKSYVTTKNGQPAFFVSIYEGIRPFIVNCNMLDKFVMDGLDAGPAGSQKVDITFSLSKGGVLTVIMKYKSRTEKHEIDYKKTQAAEIDIDLMVADSIGKEDADKEQYETISEQTKLQTEINKIRYEIKNPNQHLSVRQRIDLNKLCDEFKEMLNETSNGSLKRYQNMREQLKTRQNKILKTPYD